MSSSKDKKRRFGPYDSSEIASVRKKPKDEKKEKEDKYAEKWLDEEARRLARDQPRDETAAEKRKLDHSEKWLEKENKYLDKFDEEKKAWKEQIDRYSGKKKKFDKEKYRKEKEKRVEDGWEVVG